MKRDINKHGVGKNAAAQRESEIGSSREQAWGGEAGCGKVRKVGQCVELGCGRRAGVISRGATESRLRRQSPDQSRHQSFCLESSFVSQTPSATPHLRLPFLLIPSSLLPPFFPPLSSERLIWRLRHPHLPTPPNNCTMPLQIFPPDELLTPARWFHVNQVSYAVFIRMESDLSFLSESKSYTWFKAYNPCHAPPTPPPPLLTLTHNDSQWCNGWCSSMTAWRLWFQFPGLVPFLLINVF